MPSIHRSPIFSSFIFYLTSFIVLLIVYTVYQFYTLPDVTEFSGKFPQKTAFMQYRENYNKNHKLPYKIRYRFIPYDQIPETLVRTVVVAEDASFWVHEGIDWFELKESLRKNLKEGSFIRGGSTITQQVAKNLYLSPEKSIGRKIQEWFIARRLEKNLSKSRILELYMNIIEWGMGNFGIGAAAAFYFGKSPADLTLNEMIRLVAVLPNPQAMRPDKVNQAVLWRSSEILDRLKRFQFIDQQEYIRVSFELDSLFSENR